MSMLRFDIVTPVEPLSALPATLTQASRRGSALAGLVVLVLAGTAVLLPFLALALQLASEPDARMAAAGQSSSLLLLVLGTAIWMALFGWPIACLARRLVAGRTVTLTGEWVDVEEHTLFGRTSWREPIAAYAGLAHHLRATLLSGVRHELILVHPSSRRTVLIGVAPSFSEGDIRRVTTLLGVPEISAESLYPTLSLMPGPVLAPLQSQNA